jgi:hypothetical protein
MQAPHEHDDDQGDALQRWLISNGACLPKVAIRKVEGTLIITAPCAGIYECGAHKRLGKNQISKPDTMVNSSPSSWQMEAMESLRLRTLRRGKQSARFHPSWSCHQGSQTRRRLSLVWEMTLRPCSPYCMLMHPALMFAHLFPLVWFEAPRRRGCVCVLRRLERIWYSLGHTNPNHLSELRGECERAGFPPPPFRARLYAFMLAQRSNPGMDS